MKVRAAAYVSALFVPLFVGIKMFSRYHPTPAIVTRWGL